MLKIRLMRIGAKQRPFYRVVAVDERAKRTGAYIELLGTYNPLTEPKDIKLKQDRIDYWIKQGAQPSTGYLRIIGKAPQRLPRKPKKESKKEAPAQAVQAQQAEEPKTEEVKEVEGEKTDERPA
ncbi:30S ribosomal protein S16 [Candidatus Daviesbacteria bacterium]|nr:30S ribosomal protein S16 [Candidatus Daviesbacteria bacterium]